MCEVVSDSRARRVGLVPCGSGTIRTYRVLRSTRVATADGRFRRRELFPSELGFEGLDEAVLTGGSRVDKRGVHTRGVAPVDQGRCGEFRPVAVAEVGR